MYTAVAIIGKAASTCIAYEKRWTFSNTTFHF